MKKERSDPQKENRKDAQNIPFTFRLRLCSLLRYPPSGWKGKDDYKVETSPTKEKMRTIPEITREGVEWSLGKVLAVSQSWFIFLVLWLSVN